MTEFNDNGNQLINKIHTMADGKTEVPMLDFLNRTTLDIIGKVSFRKDVMVWKILQSFSSGPHISQADLFTILA